MGYAEKLKKLKAHEKSARAIGSTAEADAYLRKIKEFEKQVKPKTRPDRISGVWQCSCGAEISLEIDAGLAGQILLNALLFPHQRSGHKLEKIN